MNSEVLNFQSWTKADLLRVFETVTLAVVAILVILLVVRPLVTRALEASRSPQPPMVIRQIVIDYSRLPLPKLWIRGLQMYGVAAFCFGLGLGTGLSGVLSYFLHR